MSAPISDEVRERVDRWMRNGDLFADRMLAVIETAPIDTVRTIAKLYADEVRYLGDHLPAERSNERRFPCSGQAYHRCSFGGRHDPGCKAIGGNGDVSANGYASAHSCEADCEAAAIEEPWCHCSGFDCSDCELVDQLIALLASLEVPA